MTSSVLSGYSSWQYKPYSEISTLWDLQAVSICCTTYPVCRRALSPFSLTASLYLNWHGRTSCHASNKALSILEICCFKRWSEVVCMPWPFQVKVPLGLPWNLLLAFGKVAYRINAPGDSATMSLPNNCNCAPVSHLVPPLKFNTLLSTFREYSNPSNTLPPDLGM